jgi:hypothetical protein
MSVAGGMTVPRLRAVLIGLADHPTVRWLVGDRARLSRLSIAVSVGIVVGIALSNIMLWPVVRAQLGEDLNYFRSFAQHWQIGDGFYLWTQTHGSYEADVGIGNYYPPSALFLFVPFVDAIPPPLWWGIPLGITAWSVWSWRPAFWTWPLMALIVWLPRDGQILIWGNTALWIQAFVALGLRFGWPAVLCVLVKPSMLPFALIGIHRRSWWLAVAIGLAMTIPLAPVWFDYVAAMRNNVGSWPTPIYLVHDYAWLLLPMVAWLGRSPLRDQLAEAKVQWAARASHLVAIVRVGPRKLERT